MTLRVRAIALLVALGALTGCASHGHRVGPVHGTSDPTTASAECPLNAASVSSLLATRVVDTKPDNYGSLLPVLCGFQSPAQPGLTVQIAAYPIRSGTYKGLSLQAVRRMLDDGAGDAKAAGLTYRISSHPEWGKDAFSVLMYDSGKADGVEIWTTRYSSAIADDGGVRPQSQYLTMAKNLGAALMHAPK